MTIVHWAPSTGDMQPIEKGCFTGSSLVLPHICQAYWSEVVFALGLSAAYSQKPSARLAAYTWRGITNEAMW